MDPRGTIVRTFLLLIVISLCGDMVCAQSPTGARESEKDPGESGDGSLNKEKLRAEIAKLQGEVRSLQSTNEALDPTTRKASTWLGALGGIAGALIGIGGAALLGLGLNNTQKLKLEQERVLNREKHNMELFQNLGDKNVRVQLAAASVLIQRLAGFRSKRGLDRAEESEQRTIVQVLIAVTKKSDQEAEAHPALSKLIADNLVIVIDAVEAGGRTGEETQKIKPSPLKDFDLQRVQFPNAWWKRVNANEVDLFRANLSNAGLANAWFRNAILHEADLHGSVLRDADLRQADLRRADLRGADLNGARLEGAKLDGARVAGAKLEATTVGDNPAGLVDLSHLGDGSQRVSVQEWLEGAFQPRPESGAAVRTV